MPTTSNPRGVLQAYPCTPHDLVGIDPAVRSGDTDWGPILDSLAVRQKLHPTRATGWDNETWNAVSSWDARVLKICTALQEKLALTVELLPYADEMLVPISR